MSTDIIPIKDRPILTLKSKAKLPEITEEVNVEDKRDVIKLLIETFPKCFFDSLDKVERKKVKPLRIGIYESIIRKEKWKVLGVSNRQLRDALYWYTHTLVYRNKILKLKYRINLDGRFDNEKDTISKEHCADAMKSVKLYLRKNKAKDDKQSKTTPTIEYVPKPPPRIKQVYK